MHIRGCGIGVRMLQPHKIISWGQSPPKVAHFMGRIQCWYMDGERTWSRGNRLGYWHNHRSGRRALLVQTNWTRMIAMMKSSRDTPPLKAGRGTQMEKMDIERAYQIVPINWGVRPLLAIQWTGHTLFDTRLLFGLRSAPNMFLVVVDVLQWSFRKKGVT